MPGAVITIDQSRPGPSTSPGSPGVARDDIWVGWEVQLLDGAGGNGQWDWSFLYVPAGSSVQLAGADGQGVAHTANTSFTPDLPGTYRIRLITNSGGPGNLQIRVLRVRYDINGDLVNDGWALPAFGEQDGESNYPGNLIAWAQVFEFIFADIRARLVALEAGGGGGGGGVPSGPAGGDLGGTYPNPTVTDLTHVASNLVFTQLLPVIVDVNNQAVQLFPSCSSLAVAQAGVDVNFLGGLQTQELATLDSLAVIGASALGNVTSNGNKLAPLPSLTPYTGIAGVQQTASTGFDEKGAIPFDPSAISAGNAQVTRTIRFVAVLECAVAGQTCSLELFNITDGASVVTLTTSNTSPTAVTSATLTVPGDLPNAQKLYGMRLKRTGGTINDLVSCKMARLEVSYA